MIGLLLLLFVTQGPQAILNRAVADFENGRFAESAAAFDSLAKAAPERAPYLWQRGIALYYAGRYGDCRRQFESHRAVNPDDVENAAWHFLCVARAESPAKARAALLPVGPDARVPMREVYLMFRGTLAPEQVLSAAGNEPAAQFYGHLYLGLYFGALGMKERAREHITIAAADRYASSGGYMHLVARVSLLLWVDTTKLSKNLSMSAADITPRVLSRDDKNFGVIKLKLSRPMETVPIVSSIEPTDFKTFSRIKGDSLIINYYTQADSFIISLYNDTLKMLVPSAREFKDTLRIQSNFIIPAFNPYDSLTFILSNPATTFDATKIIITDSLNRPIMVSPKTDKTGRNLSLHGELPRRSKLQIRFLPNAITDIYGDGNSLTEMNVKTVGDENLGNVRLFIENLDSTKSYIVNFMQAQRIMKVIHIKGKSSLMWEVSRLLPEVFRVQIIEDENRNGVWDSTRYWQKKQAEKIINRELEKLRENWTMETKIFWE